MNALLVRYGALLHEVDIWFEGCLIRHPGRLECHHGCSACCRGLFDITLLDALYLRSGFELLPAPVRHQIQKAAHVRLSSLSEIVPDYFSPWLLNSIPEAEWDALMPEEDETPCLLLSETGGCLVYDYRPMTCRLNGIPLIDISGEELFDEWCTLNFRIEDPRRLPDLRFPFNDLFAQELLLFQELIRRLAGFSLSEVDTIIPSAVILELDAAVEGIRAIKNQL